MPKSKRNKHVELSKTKKHGLEGKKHLLEEIRSCVENYAHLFIFSVSDMRNSKMKYVRDQWKQSRFFIGKNRVMARALGCSKEEEYRPNLYKIGLNMKGERGLLFSNKSTEEVLNWFNSYSEGDYARSGNTATENVTLKEGPLLQFPHSLENYLRQLGLPTTLKKGIIHLLQDYDVCKVGDVLTPEMARLLKLLGYEMAEFHIKIECVWSQDGTFLDLKSDSKENIVRDCIKSAVKEGFQVSEDLNNDGDKMEVIECEKDESSNKESTVVDEDNNVEEEQDVNETEAQEDEDKAIEVEQEEAQEKKDEDKAVEEEQDVNETEAQEVEDKATEVEQEEAQEKQNEDKAVEEEQDINENKIEEAQKDDDEDSAEEVSKDENTEGGATDSAAMLNLTMEKLKEVDCTPPKKYSPKMTRSRARASAVKKVLTPEERKAARVTRSARKAPKPK